MHGNKSHRAVNRERQRAQPRKKTRGRLELFQLNPCTFVECGVSPVQRRIQHLYTGSMLQESREIARYEQSRELLGKKGGLEGNLHWMETSTYHQLKMSPSSLTRLDDPQVARHGENERYDRR